MIDSVNMEMIAEDKVAEGRPVGVLGEEWVVKNKVAEDTEMIVKDKVAEDTEMIAEDRPVGDLEAAEWVVDKVRMSFHHR